MQALHPDRIVAIWLRSGTAIEAWESGEVPAPPLGPAVYCVPVMANPGVKEKAHERFRKAWSGLSRMVAAYRAHDAPIGFAPDPRTAHECGDSRYLAIPFFDACLAMRLPAPGSPRRALKPVDMSRAWLAPVGGDRAVPAAGFRGDPREAGWLPDERFATAWEEYVRNGAVGDVTPPPPPTDVSVAPAEGGVEVSWNARADFESGLGGFVVLRAGQPIATLPAKPSGRFGRPLFQAMSYHDTPEAPLPRMRFLDTNAPAASPSAYGVISVNSVGLKSAPTAGPRAASPGGPASR